MIIEILMDYYIVFVIITIVLALALIGYFIDKNRVTKIRNKILEEQKTSSSTASVPNVQNGSNINISETPNVVQQNDPVTGSIEQ